MAKKKEEISYQEAMVAIETILARLRNEEMSVDELSAEVERAAALIALCKERLLRAEEQVRKTLEE